MHIATRRRLRHARFAWPPLLLEIACLAAVALVLLMFGGFLDWGPL